MWNVKHVLLPSFPEVSPPPSNQKFQSSFSFFWPAEVQRHRATGLSFSSILNLLRIVHRSSIPLSGPDKCQHSTEHVPYFLHKKTVAVLLCSILLQMSVPGEKPHQQPAVISVQFTYVQNILVGWSSQSVVR